MLKFKSYNVKKASEKNEKQQAQPSSSPSYSTETLKKSSCSASSSKSMTLAKKEKIKSANNKESPEYSRKVYPKKTVTEWHKNKTYSAKNETKKVVIPTPHKKLERK